MSYNVLPKNNNDIKLCPLISKTPNLAIFKSASYFHLYIKKWKEMEGIINKIGKDEFNNIKNSINLTCFIDINKSKTETNVFCDLIEISNNMNLTDLFKEFENCLHVTNSYMETIKFINFFGKDPPIVRHVFCNSIEEIDKNPQTKYDYIFIEITSANFKDPKKYVNDILKTLLCILDNFKKGSSLLMIKVDYLFYKPMIDFMYILINIFEKVYIIKPSTSNIISFEKYIICKNLIRSDIDVSFYTKEFDEEISKEGNYLSSFINQEIPYYFINKLTEIDVMLGQSLLEGMQEIINITNTNNKNDKLENMKKNNIQKANLWACKNKHPNNNMFLEKKYI